MSRYIVAGAVLILGLLVCSVYSVTLAQEAGAKAGAEEEIEAEYSWGVVSSISADQIVVTEQDYETDKEVAVTYTVNPETKLKNVDSLKDVKVGDSIEIDYVVKDGKNMAKIITIEKPSIEEKYTPTPSETEETGAGEGE